MGYNFLYPVVILFFLLPIITRRNPRITAGAVCVYAVRQLVEKCAVSSVGIVFAESA